MVGVASRIKLNDHPVLICHLQGLHALNCLAFTSWDWVFLIASAASACTTDFLTALQSKPQQAQKPPKLDDC